MVVLSCVSVGQPLGVQTVRGICSRTRVQHLRVMTGCTPPVDQYQPLAIGVLHVDYVGRTYVSVHNQDGIDRKSTRLNSVTNAHLVCRLLLEKKNKDITQSILDTTTSMSYI